VEVEVDAAESASAAVTDPPAVSLTLPPEPAPTSTIVTYAGHCPEAMVLAGAFCIDRYEAPNTPGQYPLVMESGISSEQWCLKHGKHLCTEDEWEAACAGPKRLAYPYGADHEPSRCNDDQPWREKDEPTMTMWPEKPAMGEVTRLYQAEKSGSRPSCVSGYGAYDMTGNVEEWVIASKKHEYAHVLKGCYWSGCYGGSKPTCKSTNAAHSDMFKFYETGFRCCASAR